MGLYTIFVESEKFNSEELKAMELSMHIVTNDIAPGVFIEHVPYTTTEIKPPTNNDGFTLRIVKGFSRDIVSVFDINQLKERGTVIDELVLSKRGQKVKDTYGCLLSLRKQDFTTEISYRMRRVGFAYSDFCAASVIADRVQAQIIEPHINALNLSDADALDRLKDIEKWLKTTVLRYSETQGGKKFIADLDAKIQTLLNSWQEQELPKICLKREAAEQSLSIMTDIKTSGKPSQEIIAQAKESITSREIVTNEQGKQITETKAGGEIIGITNAGLDTAILMLLYPLCRDSSIMKNAVTKWYKVTAASNAAVTLEINANSFLEYCRIAPTKDNRRLFEEHLLEISNTIYKINTSKHKSGGSVIFFNAESLPKSTGRGGRKWTITLNNTLYQLVFDKPNIARHGFSQIAPELFLTITEMSGNVRTINNVTNIVYNCALQLVNGHELKNVPLHRIGYIKTKDKSGQQAAIIEAALKKGEPQARVKIDLKAKTISAIYPEAYAGAEQRRQKGAERIIAKTDSQK